MRSLIVGTAGHIDHGKSALVRALTGVDPDRLKEEKERGITIDLGFAHLDLGEGLVASFIDVPGHERFVRNMLAGAHGIDAVLLVVAADESVMPQTREHFHICRLLGIPRGLVALTKCDAADVDMQALAEMEVRELAEGSFLEGAPIFRVSARTGEGLEALKDGLRTLARAVPPRPGEGLLRLPVDRAFTLRGFGTVVTGTLVSGTLAVGDEVEVLPGGRRARVRGLQVHGAPAERVAAGHRTAVNLSGLEVHEIARGDVVTQPGTLRATSIVEAELTLLPGQRALKDQARLRVHIASAEVLARVRVLDGSAVAAGATARVQLRLESPAVAGRGDRLVLRSYSPAVTIGGAVVADPLAGKRRRGSVSSIPGAADAADAAQAAVRMVEEAGTAGLDAATLAARVTVPLPVLLAALHGRDDVAAFGRDPVSLVSPRALATLAETAQARLRDFHGARRLDAGMPREELRRRVFARVPEGVFEAVLDGLAREGRARVSGDTVALADHEVRFTPEEAAVRTALLAAVRAAELTGVDMAHPPAGMAADGRVLEKVARALTAEGTLRRVGDALVESSRLEVLKDEVRRRWPPGSRLDVAGFKDLTGLSRKFVIPLLEYLDRERVTRRTGADRFVLG
ncbi:MAG TPA: selenocysteine-specific translation elongation factor [Vicinamibacteria bacterium]|nr:selenocysteine-specific translation elongation factor [Vicinamibacteria bacterium]